MGWDSFGVVRFDLWTPPSRSNEDSQEDIAFAVFLYICFKRTFTLKQLPCYFPS